MSPPDTQQTLRDIVDAIEAAFDFVGDGTLEAYSSNALVKRAVERSIEIISEACRRLPPELTVGAPEVPWRDIRGIGNILRHDYDDGVDAVIYDVVKERLPPLLLTARRLIASLEAATTDPKTGGAAVPVGERRHHKRSVGL